MGIEIERKFLVRNSRWMADASEGQRLRQGYMVTDAVRSVRVRLAGGRAWLNVKSSTLGATRSEFEYPIPPEDARQMLDALCESGQIDKTRYLVPAGSHTFEVDVFHGENAGLVVAEVELGNADEAFERPAWLGAEVTDDLRYYNACLARHPYSQWAPGE